MSVPHLPVVTADHIREVHELMAKVKVHRKEPQAIGWSSILGAYTFGELWVWWVEDQEAATIVPIEGYPYTKSEEAFHAYLEGSDQH